MAYGDESRAGTRLVTAFFEDRTAASRAVDRLTGLGIASADVTLTEGAASGAVTGGSDRRGGGFLDALADLFMPEEDRYSYAEGLRRGGYVVSARVTSAEYEDALDILDDDGTVDIGEREQTWRSEGWTGYDESRDLVDDPGILSGSASGTGAIGSAASRDGSLGSTAAPSASADLSGERLGRDEAIPIVEERLRVGKRDVNHGRVRVRSYVIEEPVREEVTLRQERVDVERRPVDRPVTAADDLFRERTIEVEEHEEKAVVDKEARVTEEVRVRKDATERTEEVADTVRRTEVEIEDERAASKDPRRRDV